MNAEAISNLLLCYSPVLPIHQSFLSSTIEGFTKRSEYSFRLFRGQPLKMAEATRVLRHMAIN